MHLYRLTDYFSGKKCTQMYLNNNWIEQLFYRMTHILYRGIPCHLKQTNCEKKIHWRDLRDIAQERPAMKYKEEKSEETKRRISSLASFSPAFRDLWEFRSLTPHAYFEPKGSYDRCTVLTRKRWMLSKEKRIGLSSQKMRARRESV